MLITYRSWILFAKIAQTWANSSRKKIASWERCDGLFPDRLWQRHDFYRVFACQTDLELSSTRTSIIVISLLKSIIDDKISEMLSLNFTTMEWKYMKLWSSKAFLILRVKAWPTQSDKVSHLISRPIYEEIPFWNPSRLETLKRFCMEKFKFSEFDLERTTIDNYLQVYNYRLHFSRFLPWRAFKAFRPSPPSSKHRIG